MSSAFAIEQALIKAHEEGRADDVKTLSAELAMLSQASTPQPDTPAEGGPSRIGAGLMGAAQGATLGFFDEAVGALPFVGDSLEQKVDDYYQRAQDAHPGTTFMGEMGGGIGAGLLTGGAALLPAVASAGGRQVAKTGVKEAAKRLGATSAGGAAVGGVAGAGFSEEGGDLAMDILKGAGGGAVGAAGFDIFGGLLRGAGRKMSEAVPMKRSESIAQRKILEALDRDKFNPATAMQRLRELGPDATLADLGPNLTGLARASSAFPGRMKAEADEFYKARSQNARYRLNRAMQSAFGKEDDFYGELQGLEKRMREDAGPLYDEAYASPVTATPKMQSLLDRPTVAEAFNAARKRASDEGVELPQIVREVNGKFVFDEVPDMQTWDRIKRAIDGKIGTAIRAGDGDDVRSLTMLKNEIVNELDEQVPAYREARMAYADPASNKDALELGRKFISEDAELTAERIASMSQSEVENFRAGAMRAIRDKILGNSNPRTALDKMNRMGQLQAVMPDEESYRQLVRTLDNEIQLQETANKIVGGSPTARIEAEKVDMGIDPGIAADLARGNNLQAGMGALRNLGDRLNVPSERLAGEIAPMLMSRGQKQQDVLTQILQSPREQFNPWVSPAAVIGGATAPNVMGLLGNQ